MHRAILALALVTSLVGCGGGAPPSKPLPKTEPVTGTVTLDDQPLSGALVTFVPMGDTQGVECSGKTDESGKFTPQQLRGAEGVPAGTYRVYIRRPLRGGKPITDDASGAAGGVVVESLPPKYSNPTESKLTATIPPGGGPVEFKLTSK
ncbi:MAG: carboxypeptidase regulatory-like domain-containing protein [Planctomycetaceae bacterium]|nr:carboxypeptidase regulatory-like domain-containing protein [Planctomycetaceae bacterium]